MIQVYSLMNWLYKTDLYIKNEKKQKIKKQKKKKQFNKQEYLRVVMR